LQCPSTTENYRLYLSSKRATPNINKPGLKIIKGRRRKIGRGAQMDA
jgi:hypothetical protein